MSELKSPCITCEYNDAADGCSRCSCKRYNAYFMLRWPIVTNKFKPQGKKANPVVAFLKKELRAAEIRIASAVERGDDRTEEKQSERACQIQALIEQVK